ncbi:MAG: hypothetical protein HGA71_14820 [Azonexaceae bacterium]|nr:hypothetical protein [Azonexaceae bacterium]
MKTPEPNVVYAIELCSGERRRWRYLAQSFDGENRWWRDEESGIEFNEANLMYAWQVLHQDEDQRPRKGLSDE